MLRELAQKREEKIIIDDDASLSKLIRIIAEKNGQKFLDFVFDRPGRLREGIAFAADGQTISRASLSRTRCGSISEFAILPPISGGT
jgi:molybdopterin converting factor small subunit